MVDLTEAKPTGSQGEKFLKNKNNRPNKKGW